MDMHVGQTEPEFDARFATGDWQAVGGSIQSLGFAHAALTRLTLQPELLNALCQSGTRIHDYGCALGDGTALLASTFPAAEVTGWDISRSAVTQARKRWPTLTFRKGDIEHPTDLTDVLWTSHTLEHLAHPAETVRRLLGKCQLLVAIFPWIRVTQAHGPHVGTPLTDDWMAQLPPPIFLEHYTTNRRDVTSGMPNLICVEDSTLVVWQGTA